METEIVEVPIEVSENIDIPEAVPEPQPKAKPKAKRGRPPGSLNKKKVTVEIDDIPQKEKKKASKKPKVPPPCEAEEDDESISPSPPPKKRRAQQQQPVHEPPDSRAIAAEVLHMLSTRHLDSKAAKREKYRSWFTNHY